MKLNALVILATLTMAALPAAAQQTLYVSSTMDNAIIKYNMTTGASTLFANAASGLNYPLGLAFDKAGSLYVGNSTNIEKFDSNGVGTVFATVSGPIGMAFDSTGTLYVSSGTAGTDTITKFDSKGIGTVFASSTLHSGLDTPHGLAFDKFGNLYVANHGYYNSNVVEFYANYKSGAGVVFATCANPTGLVFDTAGNLLVSNEGGNTIVKLDSHGVSTPFANYSSGLSLPFGLAISNAGNLYAANVLNNKIIKYDSSGNGTVFANTGLNQPTFMAFSPTPEPSPAGIMGVGIMGLGAIAVRARRRRRQATHGAE